MQKTAVMIAKPHMELLDYLVKLGVYPSRSEAIRDAVRLLVEDVSVWERVPRSNGGKVCPFCGKELKWPSLLARHIAKEHAEELE